MAEELPEPKNRKEEFLANIAGMDVELPEPANREEIYLNAIAENGGGGGGGDYTAGDGIDITNNTISVDTSTIQEKLTAGSNVAISAENVISATDTTYSAFTGTDGTAAGTSGLVPAPATTDAGKFLKADGTWDTAGGASFTPTVLTSADRNYPNNNPSFIALWKLPTGYYVLGADVNLYLDDVHMWRGYTGTGIYVDASDNTYARIIVTQDNSGTFPGSGYCSFVSKNDGSPLQKSGYSDGLTLSCYDGIPTSSIADYIRTPLSAKQGKVLNDKIEDRIITGAGAPTTSTVGTVGKLYEDTTNGKLYQCTAVSGNTYTWSEVGAGGGGGDSVYSTVTTSDQTDGGAVYIGTLNANQVENADPTSTDNHWKYLWALPFDSSSIPSSGTINIGGDIYSGRGLSNNTVIGAASIGEDGAAWYSIGNIVIGGGFGYSSRAKLGDETRTNDSVLVGRDSSVNGGDGNVALGSGVTISNNSTQGSIADGDVTIGANSKCYGVHQSVALGSCAAPTRNGEVNVGFSSDFGPGGFNDSQYRVIGGVHDGQELHDAATVAQGNTLATSAPTTSTVGVLGQLYTDTTNMHTYQLTSISGDTYTWTQRW